MESENNSSEEKSNHSINEEKSSLEEKKLKRIGNRLYDEDTINRITIVRLTQRGVESSKIKIILSVSSFEMGKL